MRLSDKYPFLTEYFTQALTCSTRPLPQALLFYGNDLDAQYTLAKEVARFLDLPSHTVSFYIFKHNGVYKKKQLRFEYIE